MTPIQRMCKKDNLAYKGLGWFTESTHPPEILTVMLGNIGQYYCLGIKKPENDIGGKPLKCGLAVNYVISLFSGSIVQS